MNSQAVTIVIPAYRPAPRRPARRLPAVADLVSKRRALFSHEVAVKVLAIFLMAGILTPPIALVSAVALFSTEPGLACLQVLFAVFGYVQYWGGRRLWRLELAGFKVAKALAVFSVFVFPVGTLFAAYLVWLFWGAKGRQIASPEYARAIAATPELDVRRAVVKQFLILAIFVLSMLALSLIAILAQPR